MNSLSSILQETKEEINIKINEIINETSLNIFVTSENYCLSLKYTPARVII